MNDLQKKYLTEVGQRLHRAGFEAGPEYNGLLPIKKDAHQICTINMHGGGVPLCSRDVGRRVSHHGFPA